MPRAAVHAVVVLGVLCTLLAPIPAAGADAGDRPGPTIYVHPVDAPVIDPFREPPSIYGAGNRGLEYGTEPGDEVRAAADGEVVFAGEVAAALHVTIRHSDGRRSSYSFLAEVGVRVGQRVEAGHVVGRAGGPVHVSVREGDTYVDPAQLFGVEEISVVLVPENLPDSPLWRAAHEAVHLAALTRLEGGGWGLLGDLAQGAWDLGGTALSTAADLVPLVLDVASILGPLILAGVASPVVALVVFEIVIPVLRGEHPPFLQLARELNPITRVSRIYRQTADWWERRSNCTPEGVVPDPPSERRIAVLVAGLDSTSQSASIGELPTEDLGYAPGDVVGFSYDGGRTPGALDGGIDQVSPDLRDIPVRPYDSEASTTDLLRRGSHLADLLVDVATASPGTTVDLFAHSQGGLVARLALADLAARPGGAQVIAQLGLVATMGSPHQGADLATIAMLAASTGEGAVLLGVADQLLDLPVDPRRTTNLEDTAVGSDLIEQLDEDGLPDGPRYLSVAGRGDLAVPTERTRLDGAEHVVLPIDGISAHGSVPGHSATAREMALALADMPPTCESFLDFIIDLGVSEAVHTGTVVIAETVARATTYSVVPQRVGEVLVP